MAIIDKMMPLQIKHTVFDIDVGTSFYDVCNFAPDYSPGWIASLGQTSAQLPQSIHVSGSM